jgi:hypothetical protein
MKKLSFNNKLYQDDPHLGDEDRFWASPGDLDRFQEDSPTDTNSNYLYDEINSDRFNSPRVDINQNYGQPKGFVPSECMKPAESFESSTSIDDAQKMYEGNLITDFNNEEKVVKDIKQDIGG